MDIKLCNTDEDTVTYENFRCKPEIEEGIDAEIIKALINRVVEKLPEQRKKIYRLSADEEKTNKEIAAEMGLSESTVRGHLKNAREKIETSIFSIGGQGDTRIRRIRQIITDFSVFFAKSILQKNKLLISSRQVNYP